MMMVISISFCQVRYMIEQLRQKKKGISQKKFLAKENVNNP